MSSTTTIQSAGNSILDVLVRKCFVCETCFGCKTLHEIYTCKNCIDICWVCNDNHRFDISYGVCESCEQRIIEAKEMGIW